MTTMARLLYVDYFKLTIFILVNNFVLVTSVFYISCIRLFGLSSFGSPNKRQPSAGIEKCGFAHPKKEEFFSLEPKKSPILIIM